MQAEPVILCLRILLPSDLNPHLLQPFRSAEAWVCISVLDKSINKFVVDGKSCTLEIWPERSQLWHAVLVKVLVVLFEE